MNSATQYHEVSCSITVYEVAMSLQVCQCVGIILWAYNLSLYSQECCVLCEKLHYLVDTRGIKNNWQRSNAMVTCVCVLQSAIKLCCHHGLLLINTRNTTSVFPYCALNLSIRQKKRKTKKHLCFVQRHPFIKSADCLKSCFYTYKKICLLKRKIRFSC